MGDKVKYRIDDSNRLVISQEGKKLLPRGRLSLDNRNNLLFKINEPSGWRREYGLPQTLKFAGDWSLDPNHDLMLWVKEEKAKDARNALTLKGEILSAEPNKLVFEIKSSDNKGQTHIQIFELKGVWKTDDRGRLAFSVNKKDRPDTLTFRSDWQLNSNQQLTYTYEKLDLITKRNRLCTIDFSGFWQITKRNRLTYILSKSSDSKFDFRAQLETPNLVPKSKAIKYRIGTGVKQTRKAGSKVICLYGSWRIDRKLGLLFDMEYDQGKVRSQAFGAEMNFGKNDQIVFDLKDRDGERLGIFLTYSHGFLKQNDAETFLRFKKFRDEAAIEAGINIPF